MTQIKNIATDVKPIQEPAHPLSTDILHFVTGQPKDFVLHLHQHQNLEINYVIKGYLTYFHCGRMHRIGQGQFCVLWASHPHVLTEVDSETSMIWFHIPLNAFLRWNLNSDFFERILEGHILTDTATNQDLNEAVAMQWFNDCQSDNNSLHNIIYQEMECRLKRMAMAAQTTLIRASKDVALFPSNAQPHPKSVSMATYIADHFKESITLNDIAKSVEIHSAYASGIFRKSFHITVNDFVNRCRIGYSIGLLGNTDRTIIDIALSSGFGSISHFYEVFNKHTGGRPSDYR